MADVDLKSRTETEDPDRPITVCAACRCASCWHGEFYCEDAKAADVTEVPRRVLIAEGNEHPGHFSDAKIAEVWGG